MLYEDFVYQSPLNVAKKLHRDDFVCLLGNGFGADVKSQSYNRYSFIALDPWAKIISRGDEVWLNGVKHSQNAHDLLESMQKKYSFTKIKDLPDYQGGWIGVWHYDFAAIIHDLPIKTVDQGVNGYWLMFDLVIAFDHFAKKSWLISTGYPELESDFRQQHAKQRLGWLKGELAKRCDKESKKCSWYLAAELSAEQYISQVKLAQRSILAGDLFEVNFTQKFFGKWQGESAWHLFEVLAKQNPSPFSAYFNCANRAVISCSPERFLKVVDNIATTCPIKGTCPVGAGDLTEKYANQLKFSSKQIAENTMIVDLVRNDLSKVCKPNSINVKKFCEIVKYCYLQHLVSEVEGVLQANKTAIDVFAALFPAGSITGAPKMQAMKCIAELESSNRGAYCGVIGYFSHTGDLDSSVLIRTIIQVEGKLIANAGGAILLDSNPADEYQECMLKISKLQGVSSE